MTSSAPSDSVESSDSCSPEAVLVRTATTDPTAALDAASVDPNRGRLLVVLATLPRAHLEQQLSELEYAPERYRVVEFVRDGDPRQREERERETEGESRAHGDLAGLSMELVGQLDWLASDGKGVLYLDSLEPYVSAAGLESTYRFLVIVAARARSSGVTLVARLDDGTLDPMPVGTLSEAFDRTVTLRPGDADGERDDDDDGAVE